MIQLPQFSPVLKNRRIVRPVAANGYYMAWPEMVHQRLKNSMAGIMGCSEMAYGFDGLQDWPVIFQRTVDFGIFNETRYSERKYR